MHPATQCVEASSSTLILEEWPQWSGAAPPRILQTELPPVVLKIPEERPQIFLGKPTCVAQAQTTGRLTRSKTFTTSRTHGIPLLDLVLFSGILNLSIPAKISHAVRSAPPVRPRVASHSKRYLCCHFATSARPHKLPINESS